MATMQMTETLATLAQQLRGEMIRPGDPAYDEARRVWNGMFDRRPAAIARVQGAVDVVAVVDYARRGPSWRCAAAATPPPATRPSRGASSSTSRG